MRGIRGLFLGGHGDDPKPHRDWSRPHAGKVGVEGMTAVRAAITAIMRETSLSALLQRCVDFNGDVDTVAAVALGAASGSEEYSADLPQALITGLEGGKWGADYKSAALSRSGSGATKAPLPPGRVSFSALLYA